MRQFNFFLSAQATARLCQNRAYSSLISNSSSWHFVAKNVPKTYASQAKKLARSLEEKFIIAEDGTVINAKNGIKTTVRADDLMSFYVTKKKTKLTPANLTDILEEMKTLQVSPLNAHSKKVYEEAREITEKSSPAEPERVKTNTSASQEATDEIVESSQPSITVVDGLKEVVKEREKPKRLYYEAVTANDLTDLHQPTNSQSQEFDTSPLTKVDVEVENVSTKLELEKTSEKSLDAGSSQARVVVEETDDKERSDSASAEKEEIIKTEIIQPQVEPSKETAPPINSELEDVELLKSEPVMRTTSKAVDDISQLKKKKSDHSDQSGSDSPPPAAMLSKKSPSETSDVLLYCLVGLSITLGIYLFKTRDTNGTSAKEIRSIPPQDDGKDNSGDLKTNQIVPETKDDVQEQEKVHSADSSHGQTKICVEHQHLEVNCIELTRTFCFIFIYILGKTSNSPD